MSKRVKPSQVVTTPPALRLIQDPDTPSVNDASIISANQQISETVDQQNSKSVSQQIPESAFADSSTSSDQHPTLSSDTPATLPVDQQISNSADDVSVISVNAEISETVEQQISKTAIRQIPESAFADPSTSSHQRASDAPATLRIDQKISKSADDVSVISVNAEISETVEQQISKTVSTENSKRANTVLPTVSAPRSRRRKNVPEQADTGKKSRLAPDKAHFTAEIDKTLHKRLKVTAVHLEVDMVNLVEPAIALYLDLLQNPHAIKAMQTEPHFSTAIINALKAKK